MEILANYDQLGSEHWGEGGTPLGVIPGDKPLSLEMMKPLWISQSGIDYPFTDGLISSYTDGRLSLGLMTAEKSLFQNFMTTLWSMDGSIKG